MRKSSRKTLKKALPKKLPWAMLILAILTIMLFFAKGGLSNNRPDIRSEEQLLGDVARHGNILDRGYRELAVSFMMKSLYARPLEIIDIDNTAALLADNLGLDEKKLARELKSERSFVWLGRRLPEGRADAILKKGIKGIYAIAEAQRFYPERRSSAHVLGFLEENNGLAGIEFFYDHILRRGSGGVSGESGSEGGHLQLTLDLRIQKLLAGGLGELLRETGAPSGTGILLNIRTGAILAMVNLPDYDPNSYWHASSVERRNTAITGSIEVGGFQYLFELAAACEGVGSGGQNQLGSVKVDLMLDRLAKRGRSTKWFEQYGNNMLSPEFRVWPQKIPVNDESPALVEYLGGGRKTGIDLPGADESYPWPSGQTTPIRLLTAFAELVNGGSGITPHLGETIIEPQTGIRSRINHPGNFARQGAAVKPATSKKIVEFLAAVSRSGSGAYFLESMRAIEPGTGDVVEDKQRHDGRRELYQTVMIGATGGQEPDLALLVALDQAIFAGNKKTPMRIMGESMMGELLRLAGEKVEAPGPEVMAASEKLIYEEWLNSWVAVRKNGETTVAPDKRGVMPELRGLSLRKALRNLQQFGLKVEIVGSGRVAAQEPAPGSVVSGDDCLLTLLVDN